MTSAKKKAGMNRFKRFNEWWSNRSPAEYELQRTAIEFEEKYFADLTLESAEIRRELFAYQFFAPDGSLVDADADDGSNSISIDNDWMFKFRKMKENVGLCDYRSQTIFIYPGLGAIEHKATLLHEMIHAYERQLSPPDREWLLLHFYRRMSKKIPLSRLRRYASVSNHCLNHNATHGLLFLFQSLELDMRFGWKPGTVFGYGRDDFFEPKKAAAKAKRNRV